MNKPDFLNPTHPPTSLRLFCSTRRTTIRQHAFDSPGIGGHTKNLKRTIRVSKKDFRPTQSSVMDVYYMTPEKKPQGAHS